LNAAPALQNRAGFTALKPLRGLFGALFAAISKNRLELHVRREEFEDFGRRYEISRISVRNSDNLPIRHLKAIFRHPGADDAEEAFAFGMEHTGPR
jgi:hypothetical protein